MLKRLVYRTLTSLIDCEAKRTYSKWKSNTPISTSDRKWFYQSRGQNFYLNADLVQNPIERLKLLRRYTAAYKEADFYEICSSMLDYMKKKHNISI